MKNLGKDGDVSHALQGMKVKRDGTQLRMKEVMLQDYDQSLLPWPITPFVKLDYCWRITYLMFKHSFVLAVPMTMVHFIWTRMPNVWQYTLRTLPYRELGMNYCKAVVLINSINCIYSALFEDYW